jgi:hypothetical protein
MKYVGIALLFILTSWTAQANFRTVQNEAFKRGEKLTYRIHYGFIDAAIATIEVEN